jgi:hypothetical protein
LRFWPDPLRLLIICMPPIDLLLHLLNFIAPAAFVSAVTVGFARLVQKKQTPLLGLWPQLAINFAICLSVLLAGLWYFGRDGKMATYAALVVCSASCQWVMVRGWRRSGI